MPATIPTGAGDRSAPDAALFVVAHPDDVDFGAAGTVALLTRAGCRVTYAVVTDGDAGGFDPDVPRGDIAGIRRREQRAAAACVDVDDVRFLGHRDGYLQAGLDLRRDIARVIRDVRPEVVVTQSPERNWERMYASHPDHLATGEATACAVYPDARNPFAFPELAEAGHPAHTVGELWIMGGGGRDDLYVDTSDVIGRKVAALRCHESQTAHMDDLDAMMTGWARRIATAGGMAEGRCAEVYRVVPTA